MAEQITQTSRQRGVSPRRDIFLQFLNQSFFVFFFFPLECLEHLRVQPVLYNLSIPSDFQVFSKTNSKTSKGIPLCQMVKNPPAMQETQVPSLGQEDPLEKGMATHSRILACEIPQTRGPGGLQSVGLQRDTTEQLTLPLMCATCAKSCQSCPTLCDSMDCCPPGSPVHEILQARILEWVAVPFSRGCKGWV